MEKRAYKRIDVIIEARFSADNSYDLNCLGTISNISENGMRIETCINLENNTKAELSIYDNDQVLHVPFKVVRIINDNQFFCAMGIEILKPTPAYLELVKSQLK